MESKARLVVARIALLGVACCALLAPADGQTLAAASGAGGRSAEQATQGHGRSAAASRSTRHGGHRHGRHPGMSIGAYGYTYGSYAPPAPAEGDPYFSDPASTGYVPYCDPGSLYYDPPSCDDMTK